MFIVYVIYWKITRNKLESFLVLAKPNKNHERHLHNHQKNPFNDLSLEYMKKIALIIVYLNFSIMIEVWMIFAYFGNF